MNVNQVAKTRVLASSLAFIAMLALCLACFPGIALAVCPKPGSEAAASGRGCPSHTGELVTLDDINASHPTSEEGSEPDGFYTQELESGQKTLPLLIIVIGFDGTPYRDDYDWGSTIFKGEYSLATYYTDMSFGQFTFEPMNELSAYGVGDNTNQADRANDGIVHVTLGTPHYDWTGDDEDESLGLAFVEALRAADPYVDFASYDTNGDGSLQKNEIALGFIVAGYEGAAAGDDPAYGIDKCLWSHAYNLIYLLKNGNLYSPETYFKPDSVTVSDYIAIAEQEIPDLQSSISALAHELGHYLGLPDLYDTLYSSENAWSGYSLNELCLMDGGCWGCTKDGRSIPTALSAPCRHLLRWVDDIAMSDGDSLLISPQDFSSSPEDSGYICASIGVDERDEEFYLVENRRYRKWDEALWGGYGSSDTSGGLVIWHVDLDTINRHMYANTVNDTDHHPGIMPLFIELDANDDICVIGDDPCIRLPFFDAWKWNHFYASALGECLTLPQYGTDPDNDVPSARTLSQSRVYFAEAENDDVLIGLGVEPCIHDLEHYEAVAPTCEVDGSVEHWKCAKCGRLFYDAEGQYSMDESDLVPPTLKATGHAWDEGVVTKAATYDEEGELTYTCGKCGATRTEAIPKLPRTSLSKARVFVLAKFAYTGKEITPNPIVKVGGKTLSKGVDYTVSYSANVNVGKVTVTVTGKGAYEGSKSAAFTITQAANWATVKSTRVCETVKLAELKKEARTVDLPEVTTRFGKATWRETAKDKKGVLSLKNGKVQVKRGAKAGVYTIKLKASVAKTKNYTAASTKTVTVTVTVTSGKVKSS